MFNISRSPEKVLKDVEIYLSDSNVPNYVAVNALKKAIKNHPNHSALINKLMEIDENPDKNISNSSPKTLYGILVITISSMGVVLVLPRNNGHSVKRDLLNVNII